MKLVICEKPSQAQAYAAVLGANKLENGFFITDNCLLDAKKPYSMKKGDHTDTCDALDDTLIKIIHGNGYMVSWCYGHLVDLADPAAYGEQYKRWDRAVLPILPEKWKYKASADKKKQLDAISSLMNREDIDCVICATDAGREGELIFRLVYQYCKCKKPIQRLWISSLEDSAIREGFTKLRPGAEFENLYYAALCRSQADWVVGINATRLFSCLYEPATLTVGRVQTPTLAMIVEREKAIAAFTTESFYTPEIDCGMFVAGGERQKDTGAAEAVRSAADGKDASVRSVEKARKTAVPPKLYDLTSLQRDANRILGFTAQQTLDYLQSLYEAKYATYPRTDSQYLTEDMGGTAKAVIDALPGIFPFAGVLSFVPDISRVTDNSKVSDHHAVIPTIGVAGVDLKVLPSGERDILTLIAARLICAVAPVHIFETVTAVLECGGYQFTAKGKTVAEDGWRAVEAALHASLRSKPDKNDCDTDDDESDTLPELAEGRAFPSVTASIREGKTKPPARFTEGTLLRAMETAGTK